MFTANKKLFSLSLTFYVEKFQIFIDSFHILSITILVYGELQCQSWSFDVVLFRKTEKKSRFCFRRLLIFERLKTPKSWRSLLKTLEIFCRFWKVFRFFSQKTCESFKSRRRRRFIERFSENQFVFIYAWIKNKFSNVEFSSCKFGNQKEAVDFLVIYYLLFIEQSSTGSPY